MLATFINGIEIALNPSTFLLIFAGTVVGVIFGALPGVSASMAVALALPFAYSMDGVVAIAFLTSVYCASITGGGITAILFKIPGTPSSAPTTFDGYPMAQRGEAGKALGFALAASSVGGLVSAFAMALISEPLAAMALKFGPGELFAVPLLGLSVVTCLGSGSMAKTIISALIGIFLATIGMDSQSGAARFTWGSNTLLSGIEMIPIMIGLFAVAEVLKQTEQRSRDPKAAELVSTSGKEDHAFKTELPSLKELWKVKWVALQSSVLGTVIGILPGAGATIASFLSYTLAKKSSRYPDKFGKGVSDGIVASEAANNAATGGAMVPLLTLGIPGGNAAAIMMSALVLKGVQVGPLLIKSQPQYLYSVFGSMFVTNIIMGIVSIVIAKIFAKILKLPYSVLGPSIIMLAALGAFALKNSTGDVVLMTAAGILGYFFVSLGYSSSSLVLGLVLGGMCEENLRRAYQIGNGNLASSMSSPITIVLLIISAVMLTGPVIQNLYAKKSS